MSASALAKSASPAPGRRRETRCHLGVEMLEDRTVPATIYGITPGNVLIRFDSGSPNTCHHHRHRQRPEAQSDDSRHRFSAAERTTLRKP